MDKPNRDQRAFQAALEAVVNQRNEANNRAADAQASLTVMAQDNEQLSAENAALTAEVERLNAALLVAEAVEPGVIAADKTKPNGAAKHAE